MLRHRSATIVFKNAAKVMWYRKVLLTEVLNSAFVGFAAGSKAATSDSAIPFPPVRYKRTSQVVACSAFGRSILLNLCPRTTHPASLSAVLKLLKPSFAKPRE